MPDSISDSEYVMLMTSRRRGYPLMANGGTETPRVGRNGEIPGNPACAVLLMGLGIDVTSMAASSIPRVKRALRAFTRSDRKRWRRRRWPQRILPRCINCWTKRFRLLA
jgi:signal transduction protein with GAF and PtsI domain